MIQTPEAGDFLLKWRGDTLVVTLTLDAPRPGRAALRTNLGRAAVRRREIIAETERGETPLARAWTDIPLKEVAPGRFRAEIELNEVGVFSGKACFFPKGSSVPEWPEGRNFHVKVESAETRRNNSIYTVFPRQFGSFREVARRLDFIMGRMGFRIIQTLPPFPVPTTYAVMGEYGCPFAARDFLSVDPAMAEFDEYTTPMDQFLELVEAVHAREGLFFIDLPANHTGWASTLQTHHSEWFHREADGRFVSPGAWGVKWADLVELDYSRRELCAYMADVFLFWCRRGIDGFRCDAGYMIPLKTWEYIVARVREEYPDTVFMLEGLGGKLETTDALLAEANLDWAYSEIFQTYDRGAFEWYLPSAIARSEKYGALVHFAETHDNDRLAKGGETYARLRVSLAALLSWQGAWGIANGVEWYATEKIDVHGKNDLSWGAERNMVELIARLNRLLADEGDFDGAAHLELVTAGDGNTLAVRRGELLILANLDCQSGVTVRYRAEAFPDGEAVDLLTGETLTVRAAAVALAPGEVRCLKRAAAPAPARRLHSPPHPCQFHWTYPRDARRTICVPEGQFVEFRSPRHFRVTLVDPESGQTLRVYRSRHDESGAERPYYVYFDAPHYRGNGTRCRALVLRMVVYEEAGARRIESAFLVPPKSRQAKVKLAMTGEEVRAHPDYRVILSNAAGAAAQMRIGWGTVASQYDAMLAANPKLTVPSDRLNLWARTRCWLQREGYLREFDAKCVSRFFADGGGRGAQWDFRVPCGMGKETAFTFSVTLAEASNAARLKVTRHEAGEDDVGDQVRLVLRPDLEWRSFHANTKAYQGLEALFPRRTRDLRDGCVFAPYDEELRLTVKGGVYHGEGQWSYNVPHPEEAARGQDGAGDLYSPGWIAADLKVGESVEICVRLGEAADEPRWEMETFPAVATVSFGEALKRALELYIVRRDSLKTVIAGYPWFLDWGRDTFIFMRGMIAAGKIADSLRILKAFAAFEEKGTLPNIIYGQSAGNRDTTDAQLWFIRAVAELAALGVAEVEPLKATCRSIVRHYREGTPNGIHVDAQSGLVWSPAHFTWMDTNYPACTPRCGYPVEIQALWIAALKFLGEDALAAQALESVRRLFRLPGGGYADCLDAPGGESAAAAKVDGAIRPNQLFLITLGLLDDRSILTATEELLLPGGMRSLSADDPRYRGVYAGDEDTERKPAYHNGTGWGWVFPLYAEAMAMLKVCSRESALQLLTTAVEALNTGAIGHVSENFDGDAPHAQKGCAAQAWSDSELLRVWLKLGGK